MNTLTVARVELSEALYDVDLADDELRVARARETAAMRLLEQVERAAVGRAALPTLSEAT